ncbi:MAG: DegT/DnrJ/EryC1/StrS family aminotransferase [Planctomycetales bacterium]|nr:DegT/DnrJ/EryC1/StrS family aminotransferase [Planctomycetales bacterium]
MPTNPINRRRLIAGLATGTAAVLSKPQTSAAAPAPEAKEAVAKAKPAKGTVGWPRWDGREEDALLDVLHSGKWGRTGGDRKVAEFEMAFAKRMQAKYCVATSSGTTSLFTALGALNIGPGDEVILPPYTFVATFNAITTNYALPVFVDSDLESLQIDANKVDAAISGATKLLLPVHIAGTPADLDRLTEISKARQVPMIEDACQAHLAEWRGVPVGTQGLGGCYSFQASKNLNSGEGGAVITNDEDFANKCYNFHTPGNPKPSASVGRAANFRLTEFQAGLLLAQMTRLEEQSKTRDANAAYLNEMLSEIPGITPAKRYEGTTRSSWHLYMFRYDPEHFAKLPRARFLQELRTQGLSASSGYTALNTSEHVNALADNPHYQRIYGKQRMAQWLESNQCPVNDRVVEQAVWLGQTVLLGTRADMEQIVEKIAKVQKQSGKLAAAS